jgi:Domain of unknown function (DUF4412)
MRMAILSACALSCIVTGAHAGAVYETSSRELGANGKTFTTFMQVQDGKLRLEHKDQGNTTVMIFKDDAVHTLDAKDKSYMVIDRATIKQLADQINPALKQMEAQLKNMPPEQRAMVEKMMGNQMPKGESVPTAEVVKTTRKDKIGGLNCSFVEVRRSGAVEQELCLAPPSSLTGGQEMFEVAKRMSALMEEMLSAFDSPMLRQNLNQQIDPYAKLDGFPVFSRYYQDGKPSMETELKTMRSEKVAAAQFDIPAGYKRKDIMPKP